MRKGLRPVQTPQHQKFTVGEIQDIADAENQGEAKGRQGIDPSLKNSRYNQLYRYIH
jgi:hypothetical protein